MTLAIGLQRKNAVELFVDSRLTQDFGGSEDSFPKGFQLATPNTWAVYAGITAQRFYLPQTALPRDFLPGYIQHIYKPWVAELHSVGIDDTKMDAQLLAVHGSELWDLSEPGVPLRPHRGWACIGSSGDFAKGILSWLGAKLTLKDVTRIFHLCSDLDPFVGPPYHHITICNGMITHRCTWTHASTAHQLFSKGDHSENSRPVDKTS